MWVEVVGVVVVVVVVVPTVLRTACTARDVWNRLLKWA